MTVRVGVIGTGFGARVVAPVFDATDGCEVVEVVSARDDAGVARLCERHDLDLVCVHSPPFLHATHVRRALIGGQAVLCDEPFGRHAGEAETLLAAAEAADSLHLCNFELRYDPVRERMRDLVAEGVIGTPEHVIWTHQSAGSRVPLHPFSWRFDRSLGGGWIGAWGAHAVDFLRWIFGDVTEASAVCRVTIAQRPDAEGNDHLCDAEDAFTATLRAGSVTIAIDTSFAAPATVAPRLVIGGSEGVIECVDDVHLRVSRRDGSDERYEQPNLGDNRHLQPMRRWAEVIRNAVQDGIAPPGAPTFADGLACARVLDQLRAGTATRASGPSSEPQSKLGSRLTGPASN